MSHKQLLMRMHEKASWESRNVYNKDTLCIYVEQVISIKNNLKQDTIIFDLYLSIYYLKTKNIVIKM
jgi:hypothetical protein